MKDFTLHSIGTISIRNGETKLLLDPAYRPALTGLEGFGYLQILWWFDGCDNEASRTKLVEHAPYQDGPALLGTFATRSPARPNPIALTCAYVTDIDYEAGVISLAYLDAHDGSPVLDIKPYTPSLDRVEDPIVPAWCRNWPMSTEESGEFDWASVFRF